ncbi:hypothetical protein P280DRAFT_471513 [Massarina eburnea CBS 473.64]|uniref:Uncharacterized protein n=1 Tax=Massarina eburnea CBS 473.64 TaxID=1395130 RepID=A0A6A6RSE5_9PLEO|nr:hypothetical protein P280DRAFT_471513 [Massarina eburnea CBS 473.64]
MSRMRSRKLHSSLGKSWGDVEYSSDGDASVHSSSSFAENTESESEDDQVTPLPTRATRTSSQTPREDTPATMKPLRAPSRSSKSQSYPQPQRGYQGTPDSVEPSFIMPSMSTLNTGSPMRKSQVRFRAGRQSTPRRSADLNNPRIKQETPVPQPEEEPKLGHYANLVWQHVLSPIAHYILGVFRYAMHHFGTPILGLALTVLFIAVGIHFVTTFLQGAAQRTFAPICLIPGSAYIVPFCNNAPRLPHSEPDFDTLVNVQSTFEEVVQASKAANDLSSHILAGTNSVADVRSLVKYSELPSRHLLDVELATFMEIGKEASEQLIEYNVKIGRTLSKVIITNDWTLRDLESLADREATTGTISRALSYINPLSVFIAPPSTIDELIFDRYVTHLSQIKEEILTLIDIATALKQVLKGLEAQLDVVGDTVIHDNIKISKNHDELLSSLWTFFGGNRSNRKANERQLILLGHILKYKNSALDHVSSTLSKLQEIAIGLDHLSADVGRPEVLGYRGDTPLRYHIEIISKSLEGFRDLRGERLGDERDSVRRAMERLSADGKYSGVRELPDSVGR